MKTIALSTLALLIFSLLSIQAGIAQNTYPAIGNMGLGTLVPTTPLEIRQDSTLDKGIRISMPGKNSVISLHLAAGANKDYGYLALGGRTKLRGNGLPSTFQGNLGIGITPRQELDIYSPNTTSEVMISSGEHDSFVKLFTRRANLNDHMHGNSGIGNQGWALIGRHLDKPFSRAGYFQLAYKGATGWKEYFTVRHDNGFVGIGTNRPTQKLHVKASNAYAQIKLERVGRNAGASYIGGSRYGFHVGHFSNPSDETSSYSLDFVVSPHGGVGIGTATIQNGYKLDVKGRAIMNVLTIRGGADLAEPFPISHEATLPKGSVVTIDPENPGNLTISTQAYDKKVAGIVSGANGVNPGLVLQQENVLDEGQHIALSGRVYVRANDSNGTIEPGDLLTTSAVSGEAMKVSKHKKAQGATIGKAMTSLENGYVLVLVSLQ